jgi:hypothetical protein
MSGTGVAARAGTSVGVDLRPAGVAARRAARPGLLLLALAGLPAAGALYGADYALAWSGSGVPVVHGVFWGATLLAVVAALAAGGLAADRGRACFWLAAGLAAAFSVPKLLRAPDWFNFYDELAHWRAAEQLLGGSSLLAENPLNKAVGFYPGLHAVTGALAGLTGWPVTTAGNIVAIVAHVLSVAAVQLLAARLLGSPRRGLLAALVFTANPAFFYFDAQFAYETLALPLVCVVFMLVLRLAEGHPKPVARALAGSIALGIAGVTVTHHASSYVLAGILAATALVAWLPRGGRRPPRRALTVLAGLGLAVPVVWTLTAARYTLDYLGPYVRSNLGSVPGLARGKETARPLFQGSTLPSYEIAGSFASVLVLAALFAVGLWWLARDREARGDTGWRAAVVLGSAYFVSLPLVALRVDQTAKRLWEFAFAGLAPVAALALARLAKRAARRRLRGPVVVAVVLVLLIGGVATRSGEHIRFPGPYAASADPRAMTGDVVASTRWLLGSEGPGHRVMGDRTLAATMGAYGEQFPVTWHYYGNKVWDVYMPGTLSPPVYAELDRSATEWVAVDERAAGSPPQTGYYFDEAEPGAFSGRTLTRQALDKFDDGPFDRRYDNGNVVLYRYRAAGVAPRP